MNKRFVQSNQIRKLPLISGIFLNFDNLILSLAKNLKSINKTLMCNDNYQIEAIFELWKFVNCSHEYTA